jgi:hypothetical protein
MHCFSIRRIRIQGLPKGPGVLPKGLEYALLTTELAAKNLSRYRLWKAEIVLEKPKNLLILLVS